MKKSILAAIAAFTVGSAQADVTLTGDTISASGIQLTPPPTAIIGPGVEFIGIVENLNFDFGSDNLTITPTGEHLVGTFFEGFGSYVFSGFDATILEVTLSENNGFSGSIINNFRFTDHSITLDVADGGIGSSLIFDIRLAPDEPVVIPTLEIRPAIELKWQSQTGVDYQVQHSSDLITWVDNGEVIRGNGSELSEFRSMDPDRQYYRVEVLTP